MADDARIGHQAVDVIGSEAGDGLDLEIGEGGAEALPLAQDREPGEPRLEALQAELLEEAPIVGDRPPPFAVVVGPVQLVAGAPPAAGDAIGLEGDAVGSRVHGPYSAPRITPVPVRNR